MLLGVPVPRKAEISRLRPELFVVYVKQFLGKGSDGYGIFMTLAGMGSVLGPRLASKFDRKKLIVWGLGAHYTRYGKRANGIPLSEG